MTVSNNQIVSIPWFGSLEVVLQSIAFFHYFGKYFSNMFAACFKGFSSTRFQVRSFFVKDDAYLDELFARCIVGPIDMAEAPGKDGLPVQHHHYMYHKCE